MSYLNGQEDDGCQDSEADNVGSWCEGDTRQHCWNGSFLVLWSKCQEGMEVTEMLR